MPGVTSRLIYDLIEPGVQKTMCKRSEVLSIVEEKKGDFQVLITLGAGDLESDIQQIEKILKTQEAV